MPDWGWAYPCASGLHHNHKLRLTPDKIKYPKLRRHHSTECIYTDYETDQNRDIITQRLIRPVFHFINSTWAVTWLPKRNPSIMAMKMLSPRSPRVVHREFKQVKYEAESAIISYNPVGRTEFVIVGHNDGTIALLDIAGIDDDDDGTKDVDIESKYLGMSKYPIVKVAMSGIDSTIYGSMSYNSLDHESHCEIFDGLYNHGKMMHLTSYPWDEFIDFAFTNVQSTEVLVSSIKAIRLCDTRDRDQRGVQMLSINQPVTQLAVNPYNAPFFAGISGEDVLFFDTRKFNEPCDKLKFPKYVYDIKWSTYNSRILYVAVAENDKIMEVKTINHEKAIDPDDTQVKISARSFMYENYKFNEVRDAYETVKFSNVVDACDVQSIKYDIKLMQYPPFTCVQSKVRPSLNNNMQYANNTVIPWELKRSQSQSDMTVVLPVEQRYADNVSRNMTLMNEKNELHVQCKFCALPHLKTSKYANDLKRDQLMKRNQLSSRLTQQTSVYLPKNEVIGFDEAPLGNGGITTLWTIFHDNMLHYDCGFQEIHASYEAQQEEVENMEQCAQIKAKEAIMMMRESVSLHGELFGKLTKICKSGNRSIRKKLLIDDKYKNLCYVWNECNPDDSDNIDDDVIDDSYDPSTSLTVNDCDDMDDMDEHPFIPAVGIMGPILERGPMDWNFLTGIGDIKAVKGIPGFLQCVNRLENIPPRQLYNLPEAMEFLVYESPMRTMIPICFARMSDLLDGICGVYVDWTTEFPDNKWLRESFLTIARARMDEFFLIIANGPQKFGKRFYNDTRPEHLKHITLLMRVVAKLQNIYMDVYDQRQNNKERIFINEEIDNYFADPRARKQAGEKYYNQLLLFIKYCVNATTKVEEWASACLDDETIPLKDRVLVACKYCSQEKLLDFGKLKMIQGSILDRLMFFGLGNHDDTWNIIDEFLHKTGDGILAARIAIAGRIFESDDDERINEDDNEEVEVSGATTASNETIKNPYGYKNKNFDTSRGEWEKLNELSLLETRPDKAANKFRFFKLRRVFEESYSEFFFPGARKKNIINGRGTIIDMKAELRKFINLKHKTNCLRDKRCFKDTIIDEASMKEFKTLLTCNYCYLTFAEARIQADIKQKEIKKALALKEKIRKPPEDDMEEVIDVPSTEFDLSQYSISACKNCHRELPRCSICAINLNVIPSRIFENFEIDAIVCMRCGHGGHRHHVSPYFNKTPQCPVADCECRCFIFEAMLFLVNN